MSVDTPNERQQRWLTDAGNSRSPNASNLSRKPPFTNFGSNTAMKATEQLCIQRQLLVDDSPRSDLRSEDFILPLRLAGGTNVENTNDDGGYWIDDSVKPDDSVTARGQIGKPKDKAHLCQREMAELRRLVQSDDRFGWALERTCQAVFECISANNPSPILALLASLVWRSLCIAWELESQSSMPKSHLRSQIESLRAEHQTLISKFEGARAKYLKELVALRDQIRRKGWMDNQWLVEISKAVYEEEPVMYYEALEYLDEKQRLHVAEIVEEKLKLVLSRLQLQRIPDSTSEKSGDVATPDPDLVREVAEARALHESSKSRIAELEDALSTLRANHVATSEHLMKLVDVAREEWQEMAPILGDNAHLFQSPVTPSADELTPAAGERSGVRLQLDLSQASPSTPVGDRNRDLCLPAFASPAPVGSPATPVGERSRNLRMPAAGDTTGVQQSAASDAGGSQAALDRSDSSQRRRKSAEVSVDYVTSVFHAGWQARRLLMLRGSQSSVASDAADTSVRDQLELDVSRHKERSQAAEAAAAAAMEREQRLREEAAELDLSRKKAEEQAAAYETEIARLKLEISRSRAREANVDAQRETEQELSKALQTIKALREEIQRLRAIIDEMQAGDANKNRLKSEQLAWKLPTGKVFERLFQDSIDRRERRHTLISSIEQARDEQALEIFRSSLLQFSSGDLPFYSDAPEDFQDTSFCPGVVQNQLSNWLVERSRKSLPGDSADTNTASEHTTSPQAGSEQSLRQHAEILRDNISANVTAKIAAGQQSSPSRSCSPQAKVRMQSPEAKVRTFVFTTSQSSEAKDSEADLKVDGKIANARPKQALSEESASAEHNVSIDAAAAGQHAAQLASQAGQRLGLSKFAAKLGLAPSTSLPPPPPAAVGDADRPVAKRAPSSASRPNSAQMLRRARVTTASRPKSAALPAIPRMQRPQSEAALAREAQRILNQPVSQPLTGSPNQSDPVTLSSALGRSSSAPGLRARADKPRNR